MNNYFNRYNLIFAYYVMSEITELHKFHISILANYINIFENINIYLLYDDESKIEENKTYILNTLNRTDINFIIIQNNPNYREGLIYKQYIIDKLDEYDGLTFFAHTKGVTNNLNLNQFENTKLWISIMYFFNLNFYYNVEYSFNNENIMSWGAIYNYCINNPVLYHWQYTGSFQWINTKKLKKYIKENNIDLSIYNKHSNIRACAEEFLGNTFDPKYAGFLNHNRYNKYFSHFLYENSNLPYYNISWVGFELTDINSYNDFFIFYKNINFKYE